MNLYLKLCLLISAISLIRSHTHDEIPKCTLTGVHKTRQTVLESPNYPNNYKPDTCWDYVIRSPYKCPTTFHIQFLDFYLESSNGCKNDYLAIGLENADDDMDVLCGQVVGIKKYHTPDGVLRLRFFADDSPWTTGKGFKLLITRLACEREELLLRKLKDHDKDDEPDNDDTVAVSAPSGHFKPPESELMQIFRNLTGQEQYQTVPVPPVFGLNYPTQLPSPPYPATGTVYVPASESRGPLPNYPGSNVQTSCTDDNGQQRQLPNYYGALNGNQLAPYANSLGGNIQPNYLPSYVASNTVNQLPSQQAALVGAVNNGFFTNPRDQYIGSWSSTPSLLRAYDNTIDSLETCCVSAFQQKRLYLSSPGFPRTVFSNILPNYQKRDCVFRLQKSSSSVCRLRLDFKFFDFGQSYHGTGSYMGNIGMPAIQNTQNVCREDFIEIDNQRFCGCRSGNMYTSYWTNAGDKKLRMRMGYSGVPSGGFLLELVQEECSETQLAMMTTKRPPTMNPNLINNQLIGTQPVQLAQPALLGQQQQNLYPGQQQSINGALYPSQQQQQQQNFYGGSYLGNYPAQQSFLQNPLQQSNYLGQQQQQQLFNNPAGFSTNLQQQNPFLAQQQQQQLQSLQNNNLYQPSYPSQFGSNYLSQPDFQHNLLQQQGFANNPFGLPQMRYARSYGDQQPVTVVETNSTRKEYYYSPDNDSLNINEDLPLMSRSSSSESSSKWDRKDTNVSEKNESTGNSVRESRKCSFDMGDILRLSVDILWITKPICYAPQRNWFTNWIG
ncbi:hypothetical protein FF38_12488 [Lucilia cuprina]|uniref:CUB domain-containing protein n=1 Tax=Lucilia cuprina TaxID=7375 RepID=A0A0L0C617_LUCCU|nr:hypothetical protein CVS40_4745 [Lucilia cuprina]KNC27838.1 hypothetical protein FF38_12488 [Lucilia cuprina]